VQNRLLTCQLRRKVKNGSGGSTSPPGSLTLKPCLHKVPHAPDLAKPLQTQILHVQGIGYSPDVKLGKAFVGFL
jgi:hypothetical protein